MREQDIIARLTVAAERLDTLLDYFLQKKEYPQRLEALLCYNAAYDQMATMCDDVFLNPDGHTVTFGDCVVSTHRKQEALNER